MRDIVERNYRRAREILSTKIQTLHDLAQALLEYETLDADQIADIMAGRPPRPPKDWAPSTGKRGGGGSTPPVNTDGAPAAI